MPTSNDSIRRYQSIFLALSDIAGGMDGITNVFIAPLRESKKPSLERVGNSVYYHIPIIFCSLMLALVDGVVHYHAFSNARFATKTKQDQSTSSNQDDLEAQNATKTEDDQADATTNELSSSLYKDSLSLGCAVACSLEVISIPFAALELLKDNAFISDDHSSSVYNTTLALTAVALVINVLNAQVMYNLSRANLASNGHSNPSTTVSPHRSNIPALQSTSRALFNVMGSIIENGNSYIPMLQSASRALFNAMGSIIENSNFVIKLCQSIGYLAGDRDFDLSVGLKWSTMGVFSLLAASVAVARYYIYQYYNSDSQTSVPQSNESAIKGGSVSNEAISPLQTPLLDPSQYHCQKSCCSANNKIPRSFLPKSMLNGSAGVGFSQDYCGVMHPLQDSNSSTNTNGSVAQSESLKGSATTEQETKAKNTKVDQSINTEQQLDHKQPAQSDTATDVSHSQSVLSEETAKKIAMLSTASSVVGRMAVPYAFITLFQSSNIFPQESYWKTVGLVTTVAFGAASLWSSNVVYDFNYYHLTHTKDDEDEHQHRHESCACCH